MADEPNQSQVQQQGTNQGPQHSEIVNQVQETAPRLVMQPTETIEAGYGDYVKK